MWDKREETPGVLGKRKIGTIQGRDLKLSFEEWLQKSFSLERGAY